MGYQNRASIAATAGPFLGLAVVAFAVGRFMDHPLWAGLLLVLATFAAAAVAWRRRRASEQHLRHVEDHARSLLEADWGPGQSQRPIALSRQDPFAPVHELLNALGERLTAQLEEVDRKTRNLESLIGALDEPVVATDNRDRIFLSNRAAEAILDAPANGLIGRPLHEVITHETLREHHAHARKGEPRRARVRLIAASGPRIFQVSASPIPAASGKGVFGVVLLLRDVTEAEKAVQVKTDFVANASHELRTPVAAIRGAAETLSMLGPGDQSEANRLVKMIEAHATRLEEMLRDLMDLSRLEADGVTLAIAPLSLADLTESLRSLFEDVCRRRSVSLAFEFEPELDGFATDRRLLLLALRNLVDNAARFTREGTTVRIVGKRLKQSDEAAASPIARFEVIDLGPGIPLEHQARVFERYYQIEQARSGPTADGPRGTGLGLSIVKHAVRALNGEVGLTSIWGQGATVWIEIPEAPAATHEPHGTGR